MKRKPPNWEKTGTLVAYAEYLRKNSGAFAVVVIRRDDAVMAVDGDIAPRDASQLVTDRLPQLVANLDQARKEGRGAARDVLDPVNE